MTPEDVEQLEQALDSAAAVRGHLARGPVEDGLVLDAVRMRLVEVGEALASVDRDVLARERAVPWGDVTQLRRAMVHRYFGSNPASVLATAQRDLPPVVAAVERLLGREL